MKPLFHRLALSAILVSTFLAGRALALDVADAVALIRECSIRFNIDPDRVFLMGHSILVNGKTRFREKVKPSLATALESYERRQDWGLIYPIKIELEGDK